MDWTQERLDALTKEWQATLRLQDWDVKAKITRGRDMTLTNHQGECEYSLPNKEAAIRILDPLDFTDSDFAQDIESAVIHELIHLHLAPFNPPPDSLAQTMQEQAIESLAKALVSLKRR